MPDVDMDDADQDLVLELIAKLRGLRTSSEGKPKNRMQLAKEKQNLLADEMKADAAATTVAKAQDAIPTTGTVRVTLCPFDKPSEKKLVVLQRAPDIVELIKVGKAKLRLKKALSARLLETGAAVSTIAELRDGAVVGISAEAPKPPEAAAPIAAPATAPAVSAEAAEEPPANPPAAEHEPAKSERKERSRRCVLPQRTASAAAASPSRAPADMLSAREALPIWNLRKALLDAMEGNPFTVVQGEPGCGKSTQLPQYLLEEGEQPAIVVTQPRRVSAVSLAHRVAEERGEAIGETVGYAVRGEVKAGPRCKLLYCTTGWLLKQLAGCLSPPSTDDDGAAGGPSAGWTRLHLLSHVVVDEVHERSMLSDLLLALLRRCVLADDDAFDITDDAAATTTARFAPPRVIAMSATIDAEAFSSYFGEGCPIIHVPGRTFPVSTMHLEEIVTMTGCRPSGGNSTPRQQQQHTPRQQQNGAPPEVDYTMLQATIEHVAIHGGAGAILVFLSGAREIERCCQAIESSRRLHDAKQQVRVLPLHGSLPPQQQRKAFDRPPDGVRKIVVSTNVAETSVTIADVVHVIDAGLAKVNSWNAATRMVTFRDERICAASAEQRRGRAGRVQEGHCYRMWPAKERLVPQAAPEIQRAPLEDLVLDACLLGASNPASFIADVLTPPKPSAVSQAVENLVSLQAIDNGEERSSLKLTPLGVHLGRLPVDPRLGKMLLLASLLECLSPILSVAAALSASARVFNAPRDKQEEASNAQREAYGSAKSDPLALAAAYDGWVAAREAGGNKAERAYCDAHYLNTKGLREIENGRRELLQHLQAAGFVEAPASVASASAHAHNVPLLRGIICAAFYPNLASATRTTAQGSRQQYEKLTLAGGDVQAWAHPSSINARPSKAESGLYVYTEKVDSSRLFLRETTRVPASAVLLFGAKPIELDVERVKQSGRVELGGGGVRIRAKPQTVLLYKLLRRELDGLLTRKARDPEAWPERAAAGKAVLETVRAVV